MKNYKEYAKQFIGCSDIAKLVYVSGDEQTGFIKFLADGSYYAYIVDDEASIPEYYNLIASGKSWLKIYDDDELAFAGHRGLWEIYRAGGFGCIIRISGKEA